MTTEADGAGPRLALAEIAVHFGGIRALDDVDLDVAPGEVLGIIGPNGAGKTTLFDVVTGIRSPTHGSVHFDGTDVTARSATARARAGMRRTFQRVQTFGWLTVEENVLAALEWRGGGGGIVADAAWAPSRRRRERARRAEVETILERCGLTDIRDETAGSLPIGIARMLELARAIADEPTLLLLDEPASGLDGTEIDRLGDLIQQIRADTGCAVMLVEHDAAFVMAQTDRVVVLDQGCVLASGTPAQIQANERVKQAYLGELAFETATAEGDDA